MSRIVLVTDSTADVPAAIAAECGIVVAAARYAFAEQTFNDGDQPAAAVFARMAVSASAPSPFGTPEVAFRKAFEAILARGDLPFCVVAPFDVNPSFTTALAAMLSFDVEGIKVLNPGVASAGLCSLLVSLAHGLASGWTVPDALDAIDRLGPLCDTLFVPAANDWLVRSGRLALIEERLGELDGALPVVRVGSRLTGVAAGQSQEEALALAIERLGARAPAGTPLNVTIDHADNPRLAADVATRMAARWPVAHMVTTELSATIGAQLGPGAVGIGVAPALLEAN